MDDTVGNAVLVKDFVKTRIIPDNHMNHPFPIDTVKINLDGSLEVIFNGGVNPHSEHVIEFQHTDMYRIGESFAWGCQKTVDGTHLNIFLYLGSVTANQEKHIVLGEYEAIIQEPVECRYPDVIVHSRNAVGLYDDRVQPTPLVHAHFERVFTESNYTVACGSGENVVHWGGQDLIEKVLTSGEICESP